MKTLLGISPALCLFLLGCEPLPPNGNTVWHRMSGTDHPAPDRTRQESPALTGGDHRDQIQQRQARPQAPASNRADGLSNIRTGLRLHGAYDMDKNIETGQDVMMHGLARYQGDQAILMGFSKLHPEVPRSYHQPACQILKGMAKRRMYGDAATTGSAREYVEGQADQAMQDPMQSEELADAILDVAKDL